MAKPVETWNGIPREKINWHPTINYRKCDGCLSCFRKCKHGVYSLSDGKPKVTSPRNCVVGCTGCQSLCPAGAISHPSESYLEGLTGKHGSELSRKCGGGYK